MLPSARPSRTRSRSPCESVEFSVAAPPPGTPATASIWSSCSEMSGETTIVGPSRSRPAIW